MCSRAFPLAALPLLVLLGACAQSVIPPAAGFDPPGAATSNLVGVDARDLQRMFGKPRLDIHDPTARKLQFANGRCVLDAYLYASGRKREPVVTYVEARTPAGAPVDPNACARALQEN